MLRKGSIKSGTILKRISMWRVFKIALFIFVCLLAVQFVFPHTSYAQTGVTNGLEAVGQAGGIAGGEGDLVVIIGRIINIVLGFVGIILLVLLMYAGYLWMTSGGEADKVEQAKRIIKNAIIGLVIVVSAFAITAFILQQLTGAIGGGGGTSGAGAFGAGSGFPSRAGSLGGGIIETHIPFRDARNVPRNTPIIITFKEPIKLSSFIRDYDDNGTPDDLSDDPTAGATTGLNDDVIKIYLTGERDNALRTDQARVNFTPDRQTFVIRPTELLGSPTVDTNYSVDLLSGRSGVLREDGSPAFTGSFSDGYSWQFEVSTFVDLTPPKITSVIPTTGGRYAPNIIVQINFNEAIDPTTASGLVAAGSGFTNIEIDSTPLAGGPVERPSGEYKVSNQYRTVEFVSDLACGTNSCGRTVFCLPTESSINVTAHAATLSEDPPMAFFTSSGFDGITDVVGNSLDGDANGTAEGRGPDDYTWNFGTLLNPNLEAPKITETAPIAGDFTDSSNQPVDSEPSARFDTILQSSSVNSYNVFMRTNEPSGMIDTFWWTPRQTILTDTGAEAGLGDIPVAGRATIAHRLYTPVSDAVGGTPEYHPTIEAGVQNVYQNCFNPASSDSCVGSPNCCDERSTSALCPDPTPLP